MTGVPRFLFSCFVAASLFGAWLPGVVAGLAAGGCATETAGTVVANAGADRTVLLNAPVTLDGSASTGVTSATWTLISAPAGSTASLSDAKTLEPVFTPDVGGDYAVELSINNGAATDSVTITATSSLVSITVPEGSTITTRERFGVTEYVVDLGASGATLSGATSVIAGAGDLTYKWEQVSGPGATVVGSTTGETLEFVAPQLGDFLNATDRYKWQPLRVSRNDTKMIFKLTITDANGVAGAGTIEVFVRDAGKEIHTTSGLSNVGIGTTVYLSGPTLNAAGASASDPTRHEGSAITDWSWSLDLSQAPGSGATFADTGTTASNAQTPSFVPDVPGIYFVHFDSTTGNAGSTAIKTVKVPGTLVINAADYVGVGTISEDSPQATQCASCHDGTDRSAPEFFGDMVAGWSGTKHSHVFQDAMDLYSWLAPEPYLWPFHTVGYNKDDAAFGFDDLARDFVDPLTGRIGFEFPADGLTWDAFVQNFPSVARLSNVQCENCHGPGSEHQGDPLRISFSFSQYGVCGQCHIQEEQWQNSLHNTAGVEHGSGSYQSSWPGTATSSGCTRCHTAKGFDNFLSDGFAGLKPVTDDPGVFPGVTCVACHDPHDATNPFQLRLYGDVTMAIDGSTVNAGKAAVCYACHDGNYANQAKNCDADNDGVAEAICSTVDQTASQYWRGGMHYVPQAPMLEGKQAIADLDADGTPDLALTENSFHADPSFTLAGVAADPNLPAENNKCVTCHMAQGPSPDEEGYQHLGGHALKLRTGHGLGHLHGVPEDEVSVGGTTEAAGTVELLSACQVCHGDGLTEFNLEAQDDYDGDGAVEGIQDEVKGLLLNLSNLIKAADTDNVNQAATPLNASAGTTEGGGGFITVGDIAWAGSCSSFTTSVANACEPTSPKPYSCFSTMPVGKTRDDYQQCNFVEADPVLRRAVWNYNSVVRDGSLGIHNAAYAIQVLQGTYAAIESLLGIDKTGAAHVWGSTPPTYQTDFPQATLR
ncbi:MAG TPA: cytochrome c3 family protein [bacterium]|nr:cytochrome c3 family protein [bacterium]